MNVGNDHQDDSSGTTSRRDAVRVLGLASLGLVLGGCASGGREVAGLPEPVWPESPTSTGPSSRYRPSTRHTPPASSWSSRPSFVYEVPQGVISRSSWAGGAPEPRLMDTMRPVKRITLHHDGMTAFTSTSRSAAAERVENIRKAHRSNNWGDVGYHYLIDPAGRVWEGRPLSWQGAHVRAQNEGNIGVCVMGNYERQQPNAAQVTTVERFVAQLMRTHGVPVSRIHSHRELAATACPGRYLQPRLVQMRSSRGALAMV